MNQPDTEEIYKILSEAKQYQREVMVKLLQANAPTQSLGGALEILNLLDSIAIQSSQKIDQEEAKSIHERLRSIEEAINDDPSMMIRSSRRLEMQAVAGRLYH